MVFVESFSHGILGVDDHPEHRHLTLRGSLRCFEKKRRAQLEALVLNINCQKPHPSDGDRWVARSPFSQV